MAVIPHFGLLWKIYNGTVKRLLPKFVRYFFVGLFCAFVNWGVFYAVNYKMGVFYLYAAALSWAVGTLVNFILSCVVFKSKENRGRAVEFAMVVIAATIGLAIDLSVTSYCVRVLVFSNMISKVIGTGAAFMFNYASRQFFIFSHK
jgi:putative flippase GtrA